MTNAHKLQTIILIDPIRLNKVLHPFEIFKINLLIGFHYLLTGYVVFISGIALDKKCKRVRKRCYKSRQCCDEMICVKKKCCKKLGKKCKRSKNCCSKKCKNKACVCQDLGKKCNGGKDCCSTNCKNKKCSCPKRNNSYALDDDSIRKAIMEWKENQDAANQKYGPIEY